MRPLITFLTSIAILMTWDSCLSGTIHVPSQQPTIQAGINAAVDGDTVLVADGTYTGDGNRDLDYGGRAIVVMSENGPEVCIIDCSGGLHRGFRFHSGEGTSSVLEGFTIQRGYLFNEQGGGILCEGSSPTIKDNVIKENKVTSEYYAQGGGVFCVDSSDPIISGNTISGNEASMGAGINCSMSSPAIVNNIIIGNWAYEEGGGIVCDYSSSPTIEGNTITGNTSGNAGGIWIGWKCSPTIRGNDIVYNYAGERGGGIGCFARSSPLIAGNRIIGNTASYGGGVFAWQFASVTVTGNTILGNDAHRGGGICILWKSAIEIENTIFWDNSAPLGKELFVGSTTQPSNVDINYSDVEGGLSSVLVDPGCSLTGLEGMITEDPLFVLPAKRDCRLLWKSP